jgi:hypothetical protein
MNNAKRREEEWSAGHQPAPGARCLSGLLMEKRRLTKAAELLREHGAK